MNEKIKELRETVRTTRPGRHTFLAYALVRGMPYRRVELTARSIPWQPEVAHLSGCTVEEVDTWLSVPPTVEMLAKAKEARDKFLEEKARRRLRILADRATSLGISA